MDQAALLNSIAFPCAMMLPCGDPRDAAGLERGHREIADAAGMPLIVYIKDEDNFGADRDAGLDAVARLVDDGVCVAIKYAVVRRRSAPGPISRRPVRRVDRRRVISGIGERPAIVHLRDFGLPDSRPGRAASRRGCATTFDACVAATGEAEAMRAHFMPLEDLRDAWGPARVLHRATELAGIAQDRTDRAVISPSPRRSSMSSHRRAAPGGI